MMALFYFSGLAGILFPKSDMHFYQWMITPASDLPDENLPIFL